MELKDSKPRHETFDPEEDEENVEMEHEVDEYGNSLEVSPGKIVKQQALVKAKSKPEPRDYDISEKRAYIIHKSLNQAHDLISFELKRDLDEPGEKTKIFFSESLDTFYQLQDTSNPECSMFVGTDLFQE